MQMPSLAVWYIRQPDTGMQPLRTASYLKKGKYNNIYRKINAGYAKRSAGGNRSDQSDTKWKESSRVCTVSRSRYMGNVSDAAYKIGSGAVMIEINSNYFDELVGTTKKDDAGNSNAVVSLAVRDGNGTAKRIDTEGTGKNTYTGQLGNYKNGNTRYYYNLDSYRKNNLTLNLDSVTSPEDMVLWSAAQYAAVNIRGYFRQEIGQMSRSRLN